MGRQTNFNRKKQNANRNIRANRAKRKAQLGVDGSRHQPVQELSNKKKKRLATRRKIIENLLKQVGFTLEDIERIHKGLSPQGSHQMEDKLNADELSQVTEYMRKMAVQQQQDDMKDDE